MAQEGNISVTTLGAAMGNIVTERLKENLDTIRSDLEIGQTLLSMQKQDLQETLDEMETQLVPIARQKHLSRASLNEIENGRLLLSRLQTTVESMLQEINTSSILFKRQMKTLKAMKADLKMSRNANEDLQARMNALEEKEMMEMAELVVAKAEIIDLERKLQVLEHQKLKANEKQEVIDEVVAEALKNEDMKMKTLMVMKADLNMSRIANEDLQARVKALEQKEINNIAELAVAKAEVIDLERKLQVLEDQKLKANAKQEVIDEVVAEALKNEDMKMKTLMVMKADLNMSRIANEDLQARVKVLEQKEIKNIAELAVAKAEVMELEHKLQVLEDQKLKANEEQEDETLKNEAESRSPPALPPRPLLVQEFEEESNTKVVEEVKIVEEVGRDVTFGLENKDMKEAEEEREEEREGDEIVDNEESLESTIMAMENEFEEEVKFLERQLVIEEEERRNQHIEYVELAKKYQKERSQKKLYMQSVLKMQSKVKQLAGRVVRKVADDSLDISAITCCGEGIVSPGGRKPMACSTAYDFRDLMGEEGDTEWSLADPDLPQSILEN